MYIFIILIVIAFIISVVLFFCSEESKRWGEAGGSFGLILFIGGILSLFANFIVSINYDSELVSVVSYPIAKIEGFEKYAFVKNNDTNRSPYINLTYINEELPVQLSENLSSVKIYDLEPMEKPCVVIRHYKIVENNWTIFPHNYITQELHINQDQIGVIYEKQKKPKVEKE